MDNIRRTKSGIAICPFFTWTSEDTERTGHNENDVNLTHCTHKVNKHDHEGNCCESDCPLLESKPEPINSCEYCGACRIVRPSGEWQFNCECDDPEKRPVKSEPTKLVEKVRTIIETAIQEGRSTGYILDEDEWYGIKKLCNEFDRLSAEKFCPECRGKMSLWCEKDVKGRMDVKNKELQAELKVKNDAFEHIIESGNFSYWNEAGWRCCNGKALHDALRCIIEMAEQVLKDKT